MDVLGSSLKDKKNTWNKSCVESAKRETELYKILEIAANDEMQEDNEMNRKHLNNFAKKKTKQRRLVPCRMMCSKTWPKQKSLELDVVFIMKSTTACPRGTKKLDDRTFPWIKRSR